MEIFNYQGETFSTPLCDQLLCGICCCVLYDPVECPCQHVFCRKCIVKWLQDHTTCPECRQPVHVSTLAESSRLIRNIILNLKIQCKNISQGCQETCSVELYEAHLKTCPYQIVKCSNGNCESQIFLKDKTKHEDTECLFYYAACAVCKKSVLRHKLLDHDCFAVVTGKLNALMQRVTELEEEKGLLQCQIREVNKKHVEMIEGITQALHEMQDLRDQKRGKYEEHAGIYTLQKEVQALRNLVETISKLPKQNVSFAKENKNPLYKNVLPTAKGIMLWFAVGVLLICFLYKLCAIA